MSDAMSNYLENALINHIFRGTAFSQPSDIYIGLIRFYEADKVEAATSPQEVSGGSYARTLQDISDSNWDAPSNGATQNSSAVIFPTATADWGCVSGVIITDHASAGNILFHGSLTSMRDVQDGATFKFSTGDLDITLS